MQIKYYHSWQVYLQDATPVIIQYQLDITLVPLIELHEPFCFTPLPVCLVGEAVFARCLSSIKDERVEASKHLQGPGAPSFTGDKKAFIEDIRQVSVQIFE